MSEKIIVRGAAVWRRTKPVRFKDHKWEYETLESTVRVMVIAENYAMVRYKGCLPFVVPVEELIQ